MAAACLAGTLGCVQRRLTIRTNPPGALVYIDNYEIGTTPVSTDFIYYGQRQIRIEKPGYETLSIEQPIPAPWYQWFPLDFVSENLVPGEIRDERVLDYQLIPQRIVPPQEILSRAEELRRSSTQPAGYVSPPPMGVAPYGPPAGAAQPYVAPPPGALPYGATPGPVAPNGAIPGGGSAPAVQLRPQSLPTTRMPPPGR